VGAVLAVVLVAAIAVLTAGAWWLMFDRSGPASATALPVDEPLHEDEHDHPSHVGHDHPSHAGRDEASSLQLSPQAQRNIGLEVGQVSLSSFQRMITVPAVVVERPGRTKHRLTAPLTGVITDVFAVSGEAVQAGDTLFILRLTHEDLVRAQTEFLKTLEALDVENREIERLESMTQGVVAGKVVLEREYEKQKLEGLLKAQREALVLHGLSPQQIEQISRRRRLLRELQITVPEVHDETSEQHLQEHHSSDVGVTARAASSSGPAPLREQDGSDPTPLVLQELSVARGDFVQAGGVLASFQDLSTLYIEGRAFEQDAGIIAAAAGADRQVTALPEDAEGKTAGVPGLQIAYIANQVETRSRALHFYVNLPNHVTHESSSDEGRRFLTWRYKPGQRMRLRVPVESWEDQLVLPVEAIAEEGAETYVFTQNGDHFDRQPVHVVYRNQQQAVVANDGSLFPGDRVALNSAHQLQMALKNKAGGGVDPHAGHNH